MDGGNMEKCWKEEFHGQCCCNCEYHLPDFYHCTTNRLLRDQLSTCICSIQKGWVCASPEMHPTVHSDWDQHGMCEMWCARKWEQPESHLEQEKKMYNLKKSLMSIT
jgi:hypothetical protein